MSTYAKSEDAVADRRISIDFNPSERELKLQLLETKRHAYNVEYCIHKLNFEPNLKDPDRPHDLNGQGNKLEWEVLSGLSMRYHEDFEANKDEFNKIFILPSVYYHRNQQYHHIVFRSPEEDISDDYITSGNIDWVIGAIDVICAQYEGRACYGGHHSFEEIVEKLKKKPFFKTFICLEMLCDIQQIGIPELGIDSIIDIPKIDIPAEVSEIIEKRFSETLNYLTEMGYDRNLLIQKQINC